MVFGFMELAYVLSWIAIIILSFTKLSEEKQNKYTIYLITIIPLICWALAIIYKRLQ